MKITTLYTCAQCSYQSSKWLGKCPQCEAWNSFNEEEVKKETAMQKKIKAHSRSPQEYDDVLKNIKGEPRSRLGIAELDRVLGGGIVAGSLILLTGEPGIGKSTLTLQIAGALSSKNKKVLYVSGEESEEQVSLRGSRLGLNLKNMQLLSETNLETIIATTEEQKPDFLIIDSIQVMSSGAIVGGAGSVSQVRLCTEAIMEYAKPRRLPVLLIGHVTKDGTLAGPRVLEHLVDTVLYLEGSRSHELRMLRGVKNRFGSATEVGIFQMNEKGLSEVENPATFLIKERSEKPIGSTLTMTMEGSRPILVEIQALTNATVFGYPRRTASGFDVNRLHLLLAVLQKYLKVNLGAQDVYINVVGGYELREPSCDLAVCAAILSSYQKKSLPQSSVFLGEVGLSGEVRTSKTASLKKEITRLGLNMFEAPRNITQVFSELE